MRRTEALRRMVAETTLTVDDLIAPLFVSETLTQPREIPSLPGVVQHTQDSVRAEVSRLAGLGVPAVILFGLPESKDATGSEAANPTGVVQVALSNLRSDVGDDIVLIADLCVDEYTSHGHCGIVTADGNVDNDATLELYADIAVAQAEAGADICAPSGMMDGQVLAIRDALDSEDHTDVAIMAYAAKYASSFTGHFVMRSMSPSLMEETARDISRTIGMPEKRSKRSPSICPRAPTW